MRFWGTGGLLLLGLSMTLPVHAQSYDVAVDADSFFYTPTNVFVDREAKLYATLSNVSSYDVEGVVHFTDNNTAIGTKPFSARANGNSEEVWIAWTPTTFGDHSVRIEVVNDSAFPDATPETNVMTVSIFVDRDSDGDGIGDSKDTDDDNDGVSDSADDFPLDPTRSSDSDGDGLDDSEDSDDDNDGVADSDDAFPFDASESTDTDGDGVGDEADSDDDNDGLFDYEEEELGTNPHDRDTDNDSVNDRQDAFPRDASKSDPESDDESDDMEAFDVDVDGNQRQVGDEMELSMIASEKKEKESSSRSRSSLGPFGWLLGLALITGLVAIGFFAMSHRAGLKHRRLFKP